MVHPTSPHRPRVALRNCALAFALPIVRAARDVVTLASGVIDALRERLDDLERETDCDRDVWPGMRQRRWLCARCVVWNAEAECSSCDRGQALAEAYDPEAVIARASRGAAVDRASASINTTSIFADPGRPRHCVNCGAPTMHLGPHCYSCTQEWS